MREIYLVTADRLEYLSADVSISKKVLTFQSKNFKDPGCIVCIKKRIIEEKMKTANTYLTTSSKVDFRFKL